MGSTGAAGRRHAPSPARSPSPAPAPTSGAPPTLPLRVPHARRRRHDRRARRVGAERQRLDEGRRDDPQLADAGAAQGFMLSSRRRRASPSSGGWPTARQREHRRAAPSTAPRWVELTRAATSSPPTSPRTARPGRSSASDTFAMATTALSASRCRSHVAGAIATATFDNVPVTPAGRRRRPTRAPTRRADQPRADAHLHGAGVNHAERQRELTATARSPRWTSSPGRRCRHRHDGAVHADLDHVSPAATADRGRDRQLRRDEDVRRPCRSP